MRIRHRASLLVLLGSMLPAVALAGAGATVYACIYMPTPPATAMVANVTAGGPGSHCMNNVGRNTTISVSQVGLNCSAVGYVESKSSSTKGDFCATDPSNWPLSYTIANTPYSGATQTTWNYGAGTRNSVALKSASPHTSVCTSQSLCVGDSAQWDHGTQGPLFIVFQPLAR